MQQTSKLERQTDLILTTFDWVPEFPRGYVRDLRVRWALEEAEHFANQPFGQAP